MCDRCEYCDLSCVKIDVPSDEVIRSKDNFTPVGQQIFPERSADSIMWTVKFRNGNVKRFKFAVN